MYVAILSVLFIIYVATWHEPRVHKNSRETLAWNFRERRGGLVDEPPPQTDTYFGNGCKLEL